MEQGLAQELTTHFTEKPPGGQVRELTVIRSQDNKEYVLQYENQTPCLIARARQ